VKVEVSPPNMTNILVHGAYSKAHCIQCVLQMVTREQESISVSRECALAHMKEKEKNKNLKNWQ